MLAVLSSGGLSLDNAPRPPYIFAAKWASLAELQDGIYESFAVMD